MAPKEKEPENPGDKAKPPKPPIKIDPVILARHKKIVITCTIVMAVCIVGIIMLSLKNGQLKSERRPYEKPFRELKDSLSDSIDDPWMVRRKNKDAVDEMQDIPSKIENSNKEYEKEKEAYRNIFELWSKDSSSPWKYHGKSMYYFSKEEKTWYDAEEFCTSRDAHLASILNNEEQNFISAQLQHTSWIGLTNDNKEGNWKWSDGSTLVTEYWSDQPRNTRITRIFRNSTQECAMMVPTLVHRNWKSNNCHRLYRWVCKENLQRNK